ncbi:MAG: alpha-amylase family glycosyl hydrolase [Myxococcota bacterium]
MRRLLALSLFALPSLAWAQPLQGETIVQYFETSWAELEARMPEIAAAGYTAIWLPPPTKGAEGVVDVGFSVFDRFDLGDRDQRGTIRTRYGTKDDAVRMVATAHRFGIKVYFDIVMNHNANPAKIENAGVTLMPARIDEFPGTAPLDYHLLPARDAGNGNYEVRAPQIFGGNTWVMSPFTQENEHIVAVTPMPAGTTIAGFTHLARAPWIDFGHNDRREEMLYSLLGLIDFALEQDVTTTGPGANDGRNLVAEQPLPRYIRLPDRPETYPNQTPVPEDIREYMMRWIAWFGDTTDADGLRLDAIKHVPREFFGSDFPSDPIDFCGTFQRNYDRRRNHHDTNNDDGVDDALLFGESFTGDLGSLAEYRATGMYLLDFPLLFKLAHDTGVFAHTGDGDIGQLSFPQGGMNGRYDEFGGLGRTSGVAFVQSHDTPAPAAQANAAYAFILTRVGHSVVFFDGNNADPNDFVQPGRADALGELGSDTITRLIDVRRRFGRGGMFNRFVDGDVYVYERVVPTVDGSGGAVLLVGITDNTGGPQRLGEFDSRPLVVTEFPPGTVLEEKTGNGANRTITVIDPMTVNQAARDRALAEYDRSSDFPVPAHYGLVYFEIPSGPDRGYVAYAPVTPAVNLSLLSGGAALPTTSIMTVGPRQLPSGAPVAASSITPAVLGRGHTLTVSVASDAVADRAFVEIDHLGQAISGQTGATATPEGLYDGMFELTKNGTNFSLDLDLSGLDLGVHMVHVKVARAGTPSFWGEARQTLLITDGSMADGGVVMSDAAVEDVGGIDAGVLEPDAGPVDTGVPNPDLDVDRDGVPNATDNCPAVGNADQRDFDGDGRGDLCDICADTPAGTLVDADGCPMVPSALAELLDRIAAAIVDGSFDASLDQNGDGVIDAFDFFLARTGGAR